MLGSINVQLLKGLTIWEMISVRLCERDGWPIFRRIFVPTLFNATMPWDRVNWSCLMMTECLCDCFLVLAWNAY